MEVAPSSVSPATAPSVPSPETAQVAAKDDRKPKIRKRAIAYAILFDVFATAAFGFAFGFLYLLFVSNGTFLYFTNLQFEVGENGPFLVMSIVFGSLFSVMAGYLAAQIGRHRPYAHAAWAGAILSVLYFVNEYTFLTMVPTKTIEVTFSHMMSILALPLAIPIYLVGAHLYTLVNREQRI